MVEKLKHIVAANGRFQKLVESSSRLRSQEKIIVTGVGGSFDAVAIAGLWDGTSRQLLAVTPDRESAERLRDDLTLLLRGGEVRFFDGQHHHAAAVTEGTRDVNDIQTLRSLLIDRVAVVVTSSLGLLSKLPSPASISRKAFTIETGTEQSFHLIVEQLREFQFEQKDFVETFGDFAVRGGIIDVFPFVGTNPVRMEFFGDTLESLREFDPLSQRSIKDLSAAVIVPDLLSTFPDESGTGIATSSLLDFLQSNSLVVLQEPAQVWSAMELGAAHQDKQHHQIVTLEEVLARFPQIHFQSLVPSSEASLDLGAQPQPSFNGSIAILRQDLSRLQERSFAVFITCDSHSELSRLKALLESIEAPGVFQAQQEGEVSIDVPAIEFSLEALHQGFVLQESGIAVYSEHQVFNRLKRRGRKKAVRLRGLSAKELQQLRRGDYVVHMDYGIGRFEGLKKIRVRNMEQEVVTVLYAEKDTLYVNLNYVNRLQKYSSKEGHIPKLTRLGSPDWERLKSRAKKRVKDIARDLIRLYARRKHTPGFPFQQDTPWQQELEASFMYEDTFDQAKTTLEVKQDMEAPHPMDRLVCGDVGFGKTEVAVRAAFKAVLSGKQVAVLVPTTILAMQHYNTFVDRTSKYGLGVEVISRFKQKKEQIKIVRRLKAGNVDIIIGTHRLLSKDIEFKDLGLLIIDEEHRFGVSAKEKLRQLRINVDTLSLTATPIPRTLHFSLMGARDLSIIATPPRNRLPVSTEITRWNPDLIKDAVMREIQRGGQVFIVHDRVQTIGETTARLQEILPGVRLRSAHGQMHAHELEEVMMEFLQRRFDVLVSTKIIESGLDIPNVNTIIVNRADRFGMAELYQLRGRVGRSNVQAYAYLLTPPVSVMPKSTIQRLQAIEEFTELGSGFNLAMRDLEIRGAGNLLGGEQSGFIESMGFDTYTRILEEAVGELKEQEFQELFAKEDRSAQTADDVLVEAEFDAFIPDDYVANDTERLAIYRQIYALNTTEQLNELYRELRDRFGKPPGEVNNLFGVVKVRLAAVPVGLKKITISSARMEADFPPESDTHFYEGKNFQQMMSIISQMTNKGVTLRQSGSILKLVAILGAGENDVPLFENAVELLSTLSGSKKVADVGSYH